MTVLRVLMYTEALCFGLLVFSAISHKFEILPFNAAFGGFALGLLTLFMVVLVGIGLLVWGLVASHQLNRAFLGAIVLVAALPLVAVVLLLGKGLMSPRIHDISTDTENNIAFSRALSLRSTSENSLEFPLPSVVGQQKGHYPHLQSLQASFTPQQSYERAIGVAESLGWKITYLNNETLTIEAIDETALFGFKDDVVVRITGSDSGSMIDVRSVSRVGVSDLGANAARISKFLSKLSSQNIH